MIRGALYIELQQAYRAPKDTAGTSHKPEVIHGVSAATAVTVMDGRLPH